jgi:Mycothiol maleylpyruvate isomerase N-terminal domain
VIDRSAEAEAFIAAVNAADPARVTACDGWTVHEIAAHVAGIAVEVIRHLEPFLQGDPVPQTRSFEEREAPLQATDHPALLARVEHEEERMRRLVDDVLHGDPDAVIPWTGRQMAVAKFIPHLRNEHALHRWDVMGDDRLSLELLGNPDLVGHSVGELGRILLNAGREHDPEPGQDLRVVLHAAGSRDLYVSVDGDAARLCWAADGATGAGAGDEAAGARLELDAAARHLFIWGRRPDSHERIRSYVTQPELARVQALLSGY